MPERLPQVVSDALMPNPPKNLGVAVSGGSDSLALLYLLQQFCDENGVTLRAVTVNHGLREEAAMEAELVAAQCAKIGVPHDTLLWEDWSGKGNLQKSARDARYSKMAAWAGEHEIDTIAVGHTADDQAETVIMRLARRSGVDGLSGMQERMVRDGVTWVRPLLRTRRALLQKYLRAHDVSWITDPSNDDERFDRIKARKALSILSDLGINEEVLLEVAEQLGQARKALNWQTFLAAKQIMTQEAGAFVIDETSLRLHPEEIQRRLLIKAISWLSGSGYAPRRSGISNLMKALKEGQASTIDGCHLRRISNKIWLFRELKAVADLSCPPDEVWDNHWALSPPPAIDAGQSLQIRALGQEGLEQCPDWRATGLPHVVLQSTPAVWADTTVIAAPFAGLGDWTAEPVAGPDAFFAALITH